MLTNKEKQAFMDSTISELTRIGNYLEAQKKLRELLLSDTNDGKLYKYRAFDKDHKKVKDRLHDLLEEQTLHCSKPSVFNDPFDCRIGVDFQSLVGAKSEIEMESIAALWEKYLQSRRGGIESATVSDAEKAIFQKWDHSANLNELLTVASSGQLNTEEKQGQFLLDHFDAVLEILQPVLENSDLKDSFGVTEGIYPKLLATLSPEGVMKLSETPFNLSEYAKANQIMDDTDEIGLTVALNRLFGFASEESAAKADTMMTQLGQKIAKELDDTFYVGCLCPDHKNRLMWSHYADCHKGFCIEYDFSQAPDDLLPLPVIYTNKRPQIPWRAVIQMNDETRAEATRAFMMALLTKDAVWDYEREWRLLVASTMGQKQKMPPISCIYLGAQCTPENEAVIREIAERKSIPVKKMVADRGEYELHCREC